MTLPVFVVDAEVLLSDVIELTGPEGRHAVVVRRIRPGEHVELTDTAGNGVECAVVSVGKHSLVAEALSRRTEPVPSPRVVVVQAIPKGEHGERAVDLLTEVGADVIVPWAAGRGVVAWRGDRGDKALAKWRSAAFAAAKQSRRLRFSEVRELHSTEQVGALVGTAALALVLHEAANRPISDVAVPVSGDVVMVVGPEGGITDDELASFAAAGGEAVRMGPSVLRSSTAGVVAAAAVLSRTSRWR
jgi:16S rRNA (uracil1498-N3)-methyltransferase